MFVIRQAKVDDAPTLLKLAKMVHFINLPADPDIIGSKIARSRRSFAGQVESIREREFMFVVEDAETGNVVGTSTVMSSISWPGHPHIYLQMRRREHYSEELQSGQVHVTLQLGTDETGPSEIGGLILGPSYRGHKDKLGLQLSLVRFHYIGLHRDWFGDRIIAEMMGAVTPDSRTLLWEYLGRRFVNLDFAEADSFSTRSKEFITSLFPKSEIYTSLLPAVARNLIGRVGPETEPARRLLERLGFEDRGHVDPFDGGPYLEAPVGEIELVKITRRFTLVEGTGEPAETGFLSFDSERGFRAVFGGFTLSGDGVEVEPGVAVLIGAAPGDSIGVTPVRRGPESPTRPGTAEAHKAPA